MEEKEIKVIKVAKSSDPKKVAGTMRYYLDKYDYCELNSIGQVSTNIAIKALALLTCIFKYPYTCKIDYFHFTKDNNRQTGIKFMISKS